MPARFGARFVVAIDRTDVGRRVSLRRRLATGQYSDVVGVLESWSDGTLLVRRRTGEPVEIPESSVVAAKVVPPGPPPRRAPRG